MSQPINPLLNYDPNDDLLQSDRIRISNEFEKQRIKAHEIKVNQVTNLIVSLYVEWESRFKEIVCQATIPFIDRYGPCTNSRYISRATLREFNQCAHQLCQYCHAIVNPQCSHDSKCLLMFMRDSYKFKEFLDVTEGNHIWNQLLEKIFEWEELTGYDANFGYYFYDCWTTKIHPYHMFLSQWDIRNVTDPEAIRKETQETDNSDAI
jgi:hypothetical protein